MRVFEWAKKYKVESKSLIKLLKDKKNLDLKAVHALEDDVVKELEGDILKLDKTVSKATSKPKKKSTKKTKKVVEPEEPEFIPPQVILIKKAVPEEESKPDEPTTEIEPTEPSSEKETGSADVKVIVEKPASKITKQKDEEKPELSDDKKESKKESSEKETESDKSQVSKKTKFKKSEKLKEEIEKSANKEHRKTASKKPPKKTKAAPEEIERREIDSPFKNLVIRNGAFKKFTPKRNKSKNKSRSRATRDYRREKIQNRLAEQQRELEEEQNTIKITDPTNPLQLAEQLNQDVNEILKKLIGLGYMVTINQKLDADAAALIAEDYGYKVKIAKLFEDDIPDPSVSEDDQKEEKNLVDRSPVVTVMGHVDHGKTLLLDVIRDSNVVEKEAGGITQSIGAYKINYKGKDIVFIDTPGHEAFTAMRARGANCTDIVVLIVAADDGIMPQTAEAINHARAADCPIIVAINKIDKENANINNVKQQLGQQDLLPEDWGGKTTCVEISALKQMNIESLLDMILLETELLELKCEVECPAEGIIIESQLEKGLGPVINVLINKGTLKKGDYFVAGLHYGKVKALIDENGKRVDSVGPSTPIQILGVNGVPESGDPFNCFESEKIAKDISEKRQIIKRDHDLQVKEKISLEQLFAQETQDVKILNLIVKTDVAGMSEAIGSFLKDIDSNKVKVNIIHSGVGGINENDITLAKASEAIVIGFNVRADNIALQLAEKESIEIRYYDIIFKLKEDIIKALEGMLESIKIENITGKATVKEIFKISKIGTIAGCFLDNGKVLKNSKVRLLRDKIVIYTGIIDSLKRFKDDVSEVNVGQEFGVSIKNYDDLKQDDELEFFTVTEKKQKL